MKPVMKQHESDLPNRFHWGCIPDVAIAYKISWNQTKFFLDFWTFNPFSNILNLNIFRNILSSYGLKLEMFQVFYLWTECRTHTQYVSLD